MKLLLLSTATALFLFAADETLNGKWKIEQNIAGHTGEMTCSFEQKGAELGGSCETQAGKVQITGKVEGKSVTFTYKSEYNNSPLTLNYSGRLDAEKLKGSVAVPEYNVDGEFAGSRAE